MYLPRTPAIATTTLKLPDLVDELVDVSSLQLAVSDIRLLFIHFLSDGLVVADHHSCGQVLEDVSPEEQPGQYVEVSQSPDACLAQQHDY